MPSWNAVYTNGWEAASWTTEQKANNVYIIASYFRSQGWSIEAICGMLGNMEVESYLNPGQWQHNMAIMDYNNPSGFGLVQWTPFYKYTDWAGSDFSTNYNKQLYRIQYELENYEQWDAVYGITFAEYSVSTENPRRLAEIFYDSYEKGTAYGGRSDRAAFWYEYLTGHEVPPWVPPDVGPTDKSKFKIMFYLKPHWKRKGA